MGNGKTSDFFRHFLHGFTAIAVVAAIPTTYYIFHKITGSSRRAEKEELLHRKSELVIAAHFLYMHNAIDSATLDTANTLEKRATQALHDRDANKADANLKRMKQVLYDAYARHKAQQKQPGPQNLRRKIPQKR